MSAHEIVTRGFANAIGAIHAFAPGAWNELPESQNERDTLAYADRVAALILQGDTSRFEAFRDALLAWVKSCKETVRATRSNVCDVCKRASLVLVEMERFDAGRAKLCATCLHELRASVTA